MKCVLSLSATADVADRCLCGRGYAGDPEATAAVITSDGWFKTGDVVVRDAQGFLTIVDRWKELIKYKGFQGASAPRRLQCLC